MKKKSLIAFMLALIFLLSSCTPTTDPAPAENTGTTASTETSDTTENPSDDIYPDTALFEKPEPNEAWNILSRYTSEDFEKIGKNWGWNIENYNANFPIEYSYVFKSDDSSWRRVVYLGENNTITRLSFHVETGERITGPGDVYDQPFSSSTVDFFTSVKKGDTWLEIKALDPNGFYAMESTGAGHPLSLHYTEDGFEVCIVYTKLDDSELDRREGYVVDMIAITPI